MVSVLTSVLVNHIRQSLSQATSLSFITAIILQIPRKLLRDQTSSSSSSKGKGSKRHRALYPRMLQRRNSNNDILFDTMAVAEYFSSASSISHATNTDSSSASSSSIPTTTTAKRKNIDISGLDIPVTPQYRPPRAPIVLCHGLYGFDKWGPEAFPALQVHYWGGIEDALAKLGAKVIVTKVPRTGSIWERARELHAILKSILAGKDVNFVAHSMGGLDCRYLLSHIHDRPYRVQSLTTVSTPHRGSPVMDWFRDHVGVGMADAIHDAAKQAHDKAQAAAAATGSPPPSTPLRDLAKLPTHLLDPIVQKIIRLLDTPAYANLTTDYCKNYFNANTRDDPNVAYYSYGASVAIPLWSVLGLPWQVVKEKEGDNDGIVSVESAKWGKYVKTVEANHWELNGQNKTNSLTSKIPPRWRANLPALELYTSADKTKFDSVEFYMEVADFLYQQGH